MSNLIQRRHGTRVRAQIPLRITSLDPGHSFSEPCHTLVVNPYGCGVRFPCSLQPGMRVRMEELPGGGSATARVASNQPLTAKGKYWLVGLGLESPGNLWCLSPIPSDWEPHSAASASGTGSQSAASKP
jgi:hypothetical protein